jgi:hypothetical protein
MFTSKGMELREMCQKVLWAGAQIAARVAEACELNDGLRALFPPQHGRRGAPGTISPIPLGLSAIGARAIVGRDALEFLAQIFLSYSERMRGD